MKQIFVLNSEEIRALRSGEPFTMQIGGQEIVLQAETRKYRNGSYRCAEKGCETLEPFKLPQSLGAHRRRVHNQKGRRAK